MVERIRLEQKKDAPADYVADARAAGPRARSPPGPVTREKAEEARRFLERRRAQQAMELCGDILQPGTLVADLATTGPGGLRRGRERRERRGRRWEAGAGAEAGGGGGGGAEACPRPIIPPLPPPSPVLPDRFAGGTLARAYRSTEQMSPSAEGRLSTPRASRAATRQR